MKRLIALVLLAAVTVTGCFWRTDADVVSENISKSADQFGILRRIVFYNGITGGYMLTIEGYCSLGNFDSERELTVTCKIGEGENYKKHFLGLSDNVTYFVEQIDSANVNKDHYVVVFKPTVILPIISAE